MTKNEIKLNEVLKEDYITPGSEYDGKYTKTTQFMLPAIGVNVKNRLIFNFFINAYLDDKGHRHQYERPVFVLFGVKDFENRDWQKVYSTLVKAPNYLMDYDVGEQDGNKLVMLVFQVPLEFENDYYHFKRGRYSRFSDTYKDKFPKMLQGDGGQEESILWQIINKAPALKRKLEEIFGLETGQLDWPDTKEIWDMPQKTREYYRYEQTLPGRHTDS
jgi:hypothetical protein